MDAKDSSSRLERASSRRLCSSRSCVLLRLETSVVIIVKPTMRPASRIGPTFTAYHCGPLRAMDWMSYPMGSPVSRTPRMMSRTRVRSAGRMKS